MERKASARWLNWTAPANCLNSTAPFLCLLKISLILLLNQSLIVQTEFTKEKLVFPSEFNARDPILAGGQYDNKTLFAFTTVICNPKSSNCSDNYITFKVSHDLGQTWSRENYRLPANPNTRDAQPSQTDIIAATDKQGRLFVSWLSGWGLYFSRSDDHGKSWVSTKELIAPYQTSIGQGAQKPKLVVSEDGDVVCIAYSRYRPGEKSYLSSLLSVDSGQTWSSPMMIDDQDGWNWYAGEGAVLSQNSTIFFVASVLNVTTSNSDSGSSLNQDKNSTASVRLYRYSLQEKTWKSSDVAVGLTTRNQPCPESAGCYKEDKNADENLFLSVSAAMTIDPKGTIHVLFNGDKSGLSPDRMFFTSSDTGLTWDDYVDVSEAPDDENVYHAFPFIASSKHGALGIAWMDNRTGWWNVQYRSSSNDRKWSDEARLSNSDGKGNIFVDWVSHETNSLTPSFSELASPSTPPSSNSSTSTTPSTPPSSNSSTSTTPSTPPSSNLSTSASSPVSNPSPKKSKSLPSDSPSKTPKKSPSNSQSSSPSKPKKSKGAVHLFEKRDNIKILVQKQESSSTPSSYKNEHGFKFPYGNSGSILFDFEGHAHLIWGEGLGWYSGGGTWYAREEKKSSSSTAFAVIAVLLAILVLVAVGVWYWRRKRSVKPTYGKLFSD